MATIVDIRTAVSGRPQRTQGTAGGSAEILLFTGVRYSRWSEGAGEGDARQRARQARDRLSLEE